MSRRKQSRPQHLEHDEKQMPGTDFTSADNKLRSVVASSNPDIKFEQKEDVEESEMTQSAFLDGERISESVPSTKGHCIETPAEKMADNDIAKDNERQSEASNDSEENGPKSPLNVHQGFENNNRPEENSIASIIPPASAQDQWKMKPEVPDDSPEQHARRSPEDRVDIVNPNFKNGEETDEDTDKILMKPPFQHLPTISYGGVPMERKHECKKCGVSFRSRETYEVHVTHYCSGKRQSIDCHICGAKFDSNKRLMIHMDVHVPQHACLLCSERMRESDCEEHVMFHVDAVKETKGGIVKCPGCDSSFNEKAPLLAHVRMRHIISEATMLPYFSTQPSFYAPPMQSPNSVPFLRNSGGVNKGEYFDQDLESNNATPHFEDIDPRDISPPVKTSTPSRPSSSTTEHVILQEETTTSAFSCIVCGLGFPDVITLQRHLLTTHTAASETPKPSPIASQIDEKTHRTKKARLNCRKVSTVSPPQLSLLSTINARKMSAPCHSKTAMDPPKKVSPVLSCNGDRDTELLLHSKKRKERTGGEDSHKNNFATTQQNALKRAKRDSEYRAPKKDYLATERDEARRVSCPVVSNKISGSEQFNVPGPSFSGQHDTERYCVQCDIKFSSLGNFRAHKQFYCASRHTQKPREGFPKDMSDDREYQNDSPNEPEGLYHKSRKRNVGNRSSMTPRKRSHLIPLETVRGSSPLQEGGVAAKPTSVRKSCPSQFGAADTSNRPSPTDSLSPAAAPNPPKKHLCQECNIWFSKYDTYIAHKKYYCESRRKDRVGVRTVQSSSGNPCKRRSESNIRDAISRSESSLLVPESNTAWGSRESSPRIGAEDGRQTTNKDTGASPHFQSPVDSYVPQYPFYGQSDRDMLARLSFMQPLILNQYITMLRERMAQGIQNNGVVFPPSPFLNLPSVSGDLSASRTRKMSADETQYSGSVDGDKWTSLLGRKNYRPARQSCVAVINVKQETDKSDEEQPSRTSSTNSASFRSRTSPLDLSNKLSTESARMEDHQIHSNVSSSRKSPYPTIDLSTTALPMVKQEPRSDFPTRNIEDTATPVTNGNGNNNNSENSRESSLLTMAVHNQQDSQVPQVKHCKNCDARFTSLSTFIAHKKYYCAGSSSGGLVRNDVKPAQLAH